MKVAIIAYWESSFNEEVNEHRECADESYITYHHIKSIKSIPDNCIFDELIVNEDSRDIFSHSDLQNIIDSIKLKRNDTRGTE